MIHENYRSQVHLLLKLLPFVAEEKCFALKGGTAINFFAWDMPRLSVDIDLTYVPFDVRLTALQNITQVLQKIKKNIEQNIPGVKVKPIPQSDGQETKLLCVDYGVQVKIEVNTVMRGHLYPLQTKELAEKAQNEFRISSTIQILSKEELFGGKICAAGSIPEICLILNVCLIRKVS